MKTEQEIDELMCKAVEAGLDGLDFMAEFDYATIAREYNGIGPSFLGEKAREKLSKYLALFAPAAVVHDMRYSRSDGTRSSFNFANIEFWGNCRALAANAYGWLNWRRYRAYAAADVLFEAVSMGGGWVAWREAYRKNGKENQ